MLVLHLVRHGRIDGWAGRADGSDGWAGNADGVGGWTEGATDIDGWAEEATDIDGWADGADGIDSLADSWWIQRNSCELGDGAVEAVLSGVQSGATSGVHALACGAGRVAGMRWANRTNGVDSWAKRGQPH